MKDWLKWALLGACLLAMVIIQFIPAQTEENAAAGPDAVPADDPGSEN